jgi:hypothetical protein
VVEASPVNVADRHRVKSRLVLGAERGRCHGSGVCNVMERKGRHAIALTELGRSVVLGEDEIGSAQQHIRVVSTDVEVGSAMRHGVFRRRRGITEWLQAVDAARLRTS